MIMKTTKEVEAAFKAQNWNYNIDEHPSGESSALITGFDLKSGRSLQIFFISSSVSKGEDLAVRVFQYLSYPENKKDAILRACNEANEQYRFVKFVCHSNGNVSIDIDMAAETQNVGAVAVELLYRLLDIADAAYPIFEKALGGSAAPTASPNSAERF